MCVQRRVNVYVCDLCITGILFIKKIIHFSFSMSMLGGRGRNAKKHTHKKIIINKRA